MKKNKKSILATLLLSICIVTSVSVVSATTYTSTLSLGRGMSLTGSSRYYTAGDNTLFITPNWLEDGDTKLSALLVRDNGTSSTKLGEYTFTMSSLKKYKGTYGYFAAGDKYYTFSTKIGNISYGGITSNDVVMSSD